MEKQELSHIQEKDITVILNGLWHKTKNKNNQHHGPHLSTVLISMRDLLQSMEKQELYLTQEKDSIATQNGLWHKVKNKKHQLHGLLLSTVLISMKDLHQLTEKQELFHTQEKVSTVIQNGHQHKVHMCKKLQRNLKYAPNHYMAHMKIISLMIKIHQPSHIHYQDITVILYLVHHMLKLTKLLKDLMYITIHQLNHLKHVQTTLKLYT